MERDIALGFLSQLGGSVGVNPAGGAVRGPMSGMPGGGAASLSAPGVGGGAGFGMAGAGRMMGAGAGMGMASAGRGWAWARDRVRWAAGWDRVRCRPVRGVGACSAAAACSGWASAAGTS